MSAGLADSYKNYFPVGAAVNGRVIKSHFELLKKHFSSITAENDMKFSETHPSEDKYTFDRADELAGFALKNNMKMRGHTLVWHNQTPDWVFENDGAAASKELLLLRMREHISAVAGRYRGKVYCWDVVNEAVEDSAAGYLRQSNWLQIAGDEYIAEAFRCAHEADPSAKLFYNDYNECDLEKRVKIYKLIRHLMDRGVPIHGIGLQGHWNIYRPAPDEVKRSIDLYASLGLELQITEMDISLFDFEDKSKSLGIPLESALDRQAELYGEYFRIFREYRDSISGVTFWGVADDATWLEYFPVRGRKNRPLVFDDNHNEKKAYREIINF